MEMVVPSRTFPAIKLEFFSNKAALEVLDFDYMDDQIGPTGGVRLPPLPVIRDQAHAGTKRVISTRGSERRARYLLDA